MKNMLLNVFQQLVILAEDNHENIEKAYELGNGLFYISFYMFEIQKRVAGTLNLYKKTQKFNYGTKAGYICM